MQKEKARQSDIIEIQYQLNLRNFAVQISILSEKLFSFFKQFCFSFKTI